MKFGWKKIFTTSELTDEYFDQLEEKLLEADVGAKTTSEILEQFKNRVKEEGIKEQSEARAILKGIISSYLCDPALVLSSDRLNVFIIIGVNGVGKTSTIAKMASLFGRENKKCMFGAADTFRAAAREQLEIWGKRLNIATVSQKQGADPASVVYDAVTSALAKGSDILFIDTAGRMHNREDLIMQLEKIKKIIGKFSDKTVVQNFLVLDAVLGRNGFEQARIFRERIGIDYIILTKVDTGARGGVLLSVSESLGVPVLFICYGESLENIGYFKKDEYLNSLFR
ncbi:signal recognition particle-docking protein FtsY [Spirochaetota bacterium]